MKVERTPHSWCGSHSISKWSPVVFWNKKGRERGREMSITNAAYSKESPLPKKYYFITSSCNSPWHAVKTPRSRPPITDFHSKRFTLDCHPSAIFFFFCGKKKKAERELSIASRLGEAHFISRFTQGEAKGCINTTNPLLPPTLALKDTRAECSRVWTTCADLLTKLKEKRERKTGGRKWKGIGR